MTTESTQVPAEVSSASDNEQGQSQGHRRRRRRRKNKGGPQQGPAAQQPQQQAQQPSPVPAAPVQQPQQQTPRRRQPQQAPPQSAQPKREQPKKKKFVAKREPIQPGNSISYGNGGGQPMRRKPQQQRGPREFVGPMDHSYRVANGNIADGPPSTINVGGSRMTHWEDPYVAPAPIRHDAPTRIYCFIEDLFFTAKIMDTAKKLGVKVEFVKGVDKELTTRLLDPKEGLSPALIVIDLNNANIKPMTLIPKFKTKYKRAVSIIGFLSHLQGDLKAKAAEAGCDTVMPRSAFSQGLPNMLRRYGVEEEVDDGQQAVL